MAGRFNGVDIFSSPTSSPPPTYPNFDSYSDNFPIPTNQETDSSINSSNRTPKIFDRFYDSSSDDEFYSNGSGGGTSAVDNGLVQSAGKRLDYMIQYLDRKLSSSEDTDRSDAEHHRGLPEFVASGGGSGIFKVPVRAGVKEGRPPSLELRPHPLRETQIGCFLRALAGSVDDAAQLWAGSECGVRFWKMSNMYAPGDLEEGEEAPFCESVPTAATLCLNVDVGNRMVWSGHKDGRIRCWKMDQMVDRFRRPFRECLSWQAHHGPVLSICITTYGDIWSGSEGGVIMIWPWEAIEKSVSLTLEERHMASLLVERSFIDPRNQVTMEGVFCSIFAADVNFLLSDLSGAKVWSAGYQSFGLWDAHTRELLKVFNIDGHAENLSVLQDPTVEEESRMKSVSGFKKEKVQTSISFFQRSRNAIMGAADAVIRVAVKGAFGEDNRRTEALTITTDGSIWSGCANGLLVQWDGSGNRVQDLHYHSCAIHSLYTFGLRIWVGYASGTFQVLDLNGNLLGEWVAHCSPVIDIAIGPGYIFTLANNGGIRGWSITSPVPLDSMLHLELAGKEFLFTRLENLKILTGTWNVGQERATHDSLISWLGSAASDVSIVAVGLQEVEMGAGFLAMSAAKETMQVGLEGSASGQWWVDMIGKTLDEGSTFQRVGSRQLAGLLIAVWARNDISSNVGDIDIAAVPCGFGRAIGNKGAVGLRMRLYGRTMCFVNCHFAAHQEAVNRRNTDFNHVYRTMMFSRPSNNTADAGVPSAVHMLRGVNTYPIHSVDRMPELSEADMVVFLGDFNYRLDDISYDEARDFISQRSFDWLWEKDQLRAEMKAGNVFQGMREAVIRFPPTYKFERHQVGLAGYDSGEKRRIPAWCDRILFRDSRAASASTCNLDCPIVSSVLQYEAIMDVTDSDHKPVRCIFNEEIARVDESIRRQEFGEIIVSNEKIRHLHEELFRVPESVVSTNNIILQNQDTSVLRITNKCGEDDAVFRVMCEGQTTIKDGKQEFNYRPRGAFGFPRWLEVKPTVGIIQPGHIAEISVRHEGYETLEEFVDGVPKNCWCEDARDKEVMVVVEVRGSCTTEAKSHRVRVRHSISAKSMPMESKPNSGRAQANVLHRSNIQWLDGSCDAVDHLRNLHTP